MRVLAIGAHPDDIELGCGATLARYVHRGHEVIPVIMTNGEAQRGADWHRRLDEACDAQQVLGGCIPVVAGLEERNVYAVTHALVERVRQVIEKYSPGVLFAHSENDRHQTHVAVAKACAIAAHLERVPTVYKFEVPSTLASFNPVVYTNVSAFMGAKLTALACFETQAERYYMLPAAIEGLAHYRAYQVQLPSDGEHQPAAEAFEIERLVQ